MLSFQMHYTTIGKELTDSTRLGIYFDPESEVPKERMSDGSAGIFSLNIPPHEKNHEVSATVVVPEDSYLRTLSPHMHFRGKRMKFIANYPDGSEEMIISVPNYNFNWQIIHELEEPVFMPAGTEISAIGAFDNSTQNSFNPAPSAEINWGEQSWEKEPVASSAKCRSTWPVALPASGLCSAPA